MCLCDTILPKLTGIIVSVYTSKNVIYVIVARP